MNSWQDFVAAEPILQQIEDRFARLQAFEQTFETYGLNEFGLSDMDLRDTREMILERIRVDACQIPGKVYYWLYPFYKGDFLRLVAALGASGAMEKQKDDDESRQAFYRFFRSIPIQERLQLGKRLNHPRLAQEAEVIQQKISDRRSTVKQLLDTQFSN